MLRDLAWTIRCFLGIHAISRIHWYDRAGVVEVMCAACMRTVKYIPVEDHPNYEIILGITVD